MSFIEYNPNPKGKVAEDCTVRAIAPGVTVFLLDREHKVLYEKTSQSFVAYDLNERIVQKNQNGSGNGLTKEEVSAIIAEALRQYNPHIPKKERNNG